MIHSFVISDEDLSVRLDKLLPKRFPGYSRSYFQHLIDRNLILLNDLPVKKQIRPEIGDEISVAFQEIPILDVKPEPIDLEILYEDEDIIAVNKPPSMVVHPAPGAYTGTFANALMHHCKELNPKDFEELRPGIVHRLDKDTSGVIIAAKTLLAHQKLTAQFASRNIEKLYLAICCGTPPEGEFSAPIKRHPIKRKLMTVHEEGKEAITVFKVLGKSDGLAAISCKLITGRTHQIRIHLKHLKCPVLGDCTYGSEHLNQKWGANRQLLHAHKLKISHPISEIPIELTAPIPTDMKNFIDQIDLS